MGAALLVEAVITGAGQFTSTIAFRGRVNVYVQDTTALTGGAWKGWVELQKQFQKQDGSWTPWETVDAYNSPGTRIFIEHETGVQYRLGVPTNALTGGTPYVRLSQ